MKQNETERDKKNSKHRTIEYITLFGVIVVIAITILVFHDYRPSLFCQIAEILIIMCICFLGSRLAQNEIESSYEEKIEELESEKNVLGKENEQLREFMKNGEKKPKKRKISNVDKND